MSEDKTDLFEDGMDEKDTDDRQQLDLYDANKGLLKRDGGPYLDQVERERDEVVRAAREGRTPDLTNPPVSVGTTLVPKHYLRETDASSSHVSAAAELENKPEASVYVDTTDPFMKSPDPMQANWDNDHQKVLAAQQQVAHNEASAKLNTPDSEPSDESFDGPNQPEFSENNENIVTGVGGTVWNDPTPANTVPVEDKETVDTVDTSDDSDPDWEK